MKNSVDNSQADAAADALFLRLTALISAPINQTEKLDFCDSLIEQIVWHYHSTLLAREELNGENREVAYRTARNTRI